MVSRRYATPVPARPAALDAAERIIERRRVVDDPDRVSMPDPGDLGLAGVVGYVAGHHNPRHVDPDAVRADVADAWQITRHLQAEVDRLQRGVLRAGLAVGMSYGELATAVGLPDRRHVHDLLARLNAACAGEVKSARGARETAAAARPAPAPAAAIRVSAFINALARHRDRFPADLGDEAGVDVEGWAAEVSRLGAGQLTALVVSETRALVGELRRRSVDTDLGALLAEGAQILVVG